MQDETFREKYPDVTTDWYDEHSTVYRGYTRVVMRYGINDCVDIEIWGRDIEECHDIFDKIMSRITDIDFTEVIRYQTLYNKHEDETIAWQREHEKKRD